MTDQIKTTLKSVFGYDEFRPLQKEIIANVLKKNDTMAIMPTGGGKSLCYQIPALIFDGLTVVISPLISLMKDQVEQLTALGVKAVFLNSSLSSGEYNRNVSLLRGGDIKMLYLAPETLFMPRTMELLSSIQIDSLTIDEAHCISEWGHDFRPEYRKLIEIRSRFSSAVCVALTATATPRVQKDIKESLKFADSNEFIASFNRENLFLQIVPKSNAFLQTTDFLRTVPDSSGIIYCFSRRQVDELYEDLKGEGYSVRPYHAGLSSDERMQNQESFIKDDTQIIVATIAFGMGINKPNIRFVIHYDLPKNIEGYYQEIGRAGRDGLRAHCLLLFSYADIQKIKYFINKKEDHERRIANMHLDALLRFAETTDCRRIPLLNYFGEDCDIENCGICDNCLAGKRELMDISIPAQKFLSCVKRTGETFGVNHIIEVLRGSKSQKVLKYGHEKLSTYDIGKEFSKKQWFHLARQFIQQGLMVQDSDYGTLQLTKKTYAVFRNEETVMGLIEEEKADYSKGKESAKDYDTALFESLRKERKSLADEGNVPPYVIFPDRTLIEMATFFPQSAESLLGIHGVGKEKAKKYGEQFLGIILPYCNERQIEEHPAIAPKKARPSELKSSQKQRHIITGELFNSGSSINDIMEEFGIKQTTVLDHLYKYIDAGYSLETQNLMSQSTISPEQRASVLKTFNELGHELLKPVSDAFDGQISYEELKILRLCHMCKDVDKEIQF